MKRVMKLLGVVLLVGLSLAQTDVDRIERQQERHDLRIEKLEQEVSSHESYLNELKEAKLRERVARLESSTDLIIKLLLAILATVVSIGAYQLKVFLQIRKHLGHLHEMRSELSSVHSDVSHLACVAGKCPDPNADDPEGQ